MAAEDFKTRREVGIAIEGIKHRLNLMTGVFALSVFIGAGALGYVASRVEMVANRVATVAEDLAEMTGQLKGFGDQLASIRATIDEIRANQRQPQKRSAVGVPAATYTGIVE
jgi:hypothetical protein